VPLEKTAPQNPAVGPDSNHRAAKNADTAATDSTTHPVQRPEPAAIIDGLRLLSHGRGRGPHKRRTAPPAVGGTDESVPSQVATISDFLPVVFSRGGKALSASRLRRLFKAGLCAPAAALSNSLSLERRCQREIRVRQRSNGHQIGKAGGVPLVDRHIA
jgi:hypothetical protein